jgi:pheromone shutdown protein TraB
MVELLIQSFEEDPDSYREMLSSHFPQLSRALLDEREEFMFRGLEYALTKHDRVVAVVGAGHVSELVKRLESIGVEVDAIPVSWVRRWGMERIDIS